MPINKIRGQEQYVYDVDSPHTTEAAYLGQIAIIERSVTEAAAASNTAVHASITAGEAAQTITTGITNPPCPRNITISCAKGSAEGDNMEGNVVITGTNIFGETITDTIAEGADGTIEGTVAFKTVTSILVPARVSEGNAITVGFGDKLGLPFYLYHIDQVIQCSLNYAIESNRATVVADDDEIEKNTILLNSALNDQVVRIIVAIYRE